MFNPVGYAQQRIATDWECSCILTWIGLLVEACGLMREVKELLFLLLQSRSLYTVEYKRNPIRGYAHNSAGPGGQDT